MTSIAAFQPHGLIQTPIQQQLYFKAHIANIYAGISNPKETETVALMEVILYRNIFTEPYFIVNSQQPPTPTSDRRCDLVVRYLESGYEDVRTLLFAECKRTSTSQAFSLKALEEQAKEYCQLHLQYAKNSTFVYAATMAGAHIRLWTYGLDQDPWVPLWGLNHPGDWGQYKDVGSNSAGLELERHFERIKMAPQGLYAGQDHSGYGTPYPTSTSSTSGFQPTTLGHQSARTSYQLSAPRALASPYMYSVPDSQTVTGAQTSQIALSVAPSGAPASQYMYSIPASQTVPRAQIGKSADELFGEEVQEDRDDEESRDNEGGEEAGGDTQMGGVAETKQTTSSDAKPKYVVNVSKKSHRTRSNEYNFKDARGKTKTTERKDWNKTKLNGKTAWKYNDYYTYNLPI
jgi:hypothetical protein